MKFLKLSGKTPSEKDRLTRLVIGRISEGKQDLSILVGIGSNIQNALEDLEIAWKISVEVAGVNVLGCGVMKVGISVGLVSVVVMMLGWNLDDILLILSIKNSKTVDANVFGHKKVGRMEGLFWDQWESWPAKVFLDYFYFLKQNFCKNFLWTQWLI